LLLGRRRLLRLWDMPLRILRGLIRLLRRWGRDFSEHFHTADNPVENAGDNPLAGELIFINVIRQDQRLQNWFGHSSTCAKRYSKNGNEAILPEIRRGVDAPVGSECKEHYSSLIFTNGHPS
jgi:hypothetical protein